MGGFLPTPNPSATTQPAPGPAPDVNAPVPNVASGISTLSQPGVQGTQEFQQAQGFEQKAQEANQRAADLANQPIVSPKAPHAQLTQIISSIASGLSAFGTSLSTHGKEGGAAEVAQIQGQQQQQKLAQQQQEMSQRNQQINQQLMVGDTNHKMAQNIWLMAQMPNEVAESDLKVKQGQNTVQGQKLGNISTAQDVRTKALQDLVQTGDVDAYNSTLQQVGGVTGTPPAVGGAPAAPGASTVPPAARASWQNSVDAAVKAYPDDASIRQSAATLADPNADPKAMASAAIGAANRQKALDAGTKSQAEQLNTKKTAAETETAEEPARYMRIEADQTLGKPVSAEDKAFAAAYEKKTTLGQRYIVQSGGNITGGALDDLATAYHQTGVLPQTGMGPAGTAMRVSIINHAHEMFGDQTLAANSAEYKANEKSLANVQKTFDQVNAFESTAGKNLGLFLDQAKKIVDSGVPWVNQPLRSVQRNGLGSADQTAFDTARQVAVNEIGRVLNTSSGAGVVSDSARQEVSSLIGPNATLAQITKAADILTQDMANRRSAYQGQISDIQKRLGGAAAPQDQNAAPAAQSAPTPQSHVFDSKAWSAANPGKDLNAAIASAKQQGYEVK